MQFNYEYDVKLPVGFMGAGEHAYANVLPCLQYAPVELVALSDPDPDRGLAVARQFGARHFYPNHKALLSKEENLAAVFIVVGPDAEGRPRYPDLGAAALAAGFHTWIDAPPCATEDDIKAFTDACLKSHKYIATGFKRMFAPAYVKVAEIIESPAFGKVSSFSMRYPLYLPTAEEAETELARTMFLQFVHPYALLVRLFGESQAFSYVRSGVSGGGVISLAYRNGTVGTLHCTSGQAMTGPVERLEVIGEGAHVVVENGTRLTYYRAGGVRGADTDERPDTYMGADACAPIVWEPEFSMGELYSQEFVLSGYLGSIAYFCQQTLAEKPLKHGNLVDMLHIMSIHDKILETDERKWTDPY